MTGRKVPDQAEGGVWAQCPSLPRHSPGAEGAGAIFLAYVSLFVPGCRHPGVGCLWAGTRVPACPPSPPGVGKPQPGR